jgi:DNA repair protein RecN (Recombination protein N)
MLQRLHIRNYAIIDELSIDFHPQFNIITGETGAGKSILVGALGLVLGNRADTSLLRNVSAKCLVEASFHLAENESIRQLLTSNDLDESDDVIIRREIAPNGKSRSFINDTPVTLIALRQFAAQLVDLHQQFDTLDLGEDDFQRSVVDALANHPELLLQYKHSFEKHQVTANQLKHLQAQKTEADKAADYNQYLFTELEEAKLQPNELEDLDGELDLLSHAESIKAVLQLVMYNLQDGEQPLVQQIKSLGQQLQGLRSTHTGIENCFQRMQSVQIELQDIADEITQINETISLNPERLQVVNDRIAMGYKLLKKHNVTLEVINKKGPSGYPEVKLTGDTKDLKAVLADDEYGWDDEDLADYIEESNTEN